MEHFTMGDEPIASTSVQKRKPVFDRYFGFVENLRPSDKLIYLLTLLVFVGSIFYVLITYSNQNRITIATSGGTLAEGIIGTPRFVNPVLAITRADQDLVTLIYSGLLKLGTDGQLQNDVAETITISDDGTVYNVILKNNVVFHDYTPLTTADIAFTVGLIQDPILKSPLRANWNDVTVEVINDHEINFVLTEPYEPFIENLTVGILPKHIWSNLSIEQLPFSQNNTEPIGSGPYILEDVDYNTAGLIEAYTLEAFEGSATQANISNLLLRFYPNEQELLAGFAEEEFMSTASFSYDSLKYIDSGTHTVIEHPLPRVFSIFLNQNKSAAFREENVRKALEAAIDREVLIEVALSGYGVPTASPIPPLFIPVESLGTSSPNTATSGIRYAEELLIDAGWEQQEDKSWMKDIDNVPTKLSVTLTTSNTAVFERTAEYLKSAWEALGVEVSIALFEQSDLVQVIIRPRDYQALLFGTDVGRSLDLYPFWHSSQKDDPGLNVALYTNISTDDHLETARTTQDAEEKYAALLAFEKEVQEETPAIFLYSPLFTYVVENEAVVSPIERIIKPSERFTNIDTWYMKHSNVWPIFSN